MAQSTSINGVRYDFTTISLTGTTANSNLGGPVNFSSGPGAFAKGVIQAINYDASQDAGVVQGNQISMVGRTNGYGVGSGSLEILVSEFDDWCARVTAQGVLPLMSVFFDLTIAYSVNQYDTRTDVLQGIKITKVGSQNQKGNDATTVSLDLNIAQIYKAGIAMFGDPA